MLRQIKRKLNSSAGVTVLFALVGFLVASAASLVIVTVALNNAGRVNGQREEQQEYLDITSAATLLREELSGQEVTFVQTLDPEMTVTDPGEPSGGRELAQALALAVLNRGWDGNAFTDSFTLTANGKSTSVDVSYSGSRLEMSLTPKDTGRSLTIPAMLVFDGVKAEQISLVPYYRVVYNTLTETTEYVLDHYTRTVRVFFDADRIHAESK